MRNTLMLLLRTGALCAVLVSTLAGAEFLPLAPGNTWVYRSAQTKTEFTIRVGTSLLYLGYCLQPPLDCLKSQSIYGVTRMFLCFIPIPLGADSKTHRQC